MSADLIRKIIQSKDISYRSKFLIIWEAGINQGMSAKDARDYAQLELSGGLFHGNV